MIPKSMLPASAALQIVSQIAATRRNVSRVLLEGIPAQPARPAMIQGGRAIPETEATPAIPAADIQAALGDELLNVFAFIGGDYQESE